MAGHKLVDLFDVMTRYIGDYENQFIKEIGECGLTLRQIHYIDTVGMLKHPTLGELAIELALSRPSVTAIIEKLAKAGYIERVRSDKDRRSAHVHLTRKGEELVSKHKEAHRKIAHLFEENLDRRDLTALTEILNRAVEKLLIK